MRIDSEASHEYNGSRSPSTSPAAPSGDVRAALEALQHAPAVRHARVEELKRQVEEGSFRVDARAIASKLFRW